MKDSEPTIVLSRATVIYDRSLDKPDVPYSVSVDEVSLAELLHTFGLHDNDIAKLKLVVTRKGSTAGSYDAGATPFGPLSEKPDKVITLQTDWVWEEYQRKLKVAERITSGEEKPKEQFKDFLATKKLPLYLTLVPAERGIAFANKLLQNATQRKFNSVLLHESKHAIDDSKYALWRRPLHEEALAFGLPQIAYNVAYYELAGPLLVDKPAGIYLAGLIGGMWATYQLTGRVLGRLNITLNQTQRAANKFAQELENQPRWRSIATIGPRET